MALYITSKILQSTCMSTSVSEEPESVTSFTHAKSVESCPTLCNPVDCNPPGSSVHGILQARILEWIAMPFPGALPNLGTEPMSPVAPALQADSLLLSHRETSFIEMCYTLVSCLPGLPTPESLMYSCPGSDESRSQHRESRPCSAFLWGARQWLALAYASTLCFQQRLSLPALTCTCLFFCFLIVVLAVMWPSSKTFPTWGMSSTGKWARWEASGQFRHLKVLVAQSCPTLGNSMGSSLPGSSVHGILQARILEWVAILFSQGSSRPRD